jgi:hypothetical protein
LLIVMLERGQSISKGEELIEIQMTLQRLEMMPQVMMLFVQQRLEQHQHVVLPEEVPMEIVKAPQGGVMLIYLPQGRQEGGEMQMKRIWVM